MKKILGSKGMTIVEIILAIGLVSIVMVQVLNLLVDLKNEQVLGEGKTRDLSNRSIIMQQVQNDFVNKTITSINDCDSLSEKINNRDVYKMKSCVKVVYNNETAKPYFLITATNKDNDYDYFIYGYSDTADSKTPLHYEAWRLESGHYPGSGNASDCQYQLQYYDCFEGGEKVCESRYFALKYPVLMSSSVSNTIMNFDLEFLYYFRSNINPPVDFEAHTNYWTKHSTDCRA